MKLHSMYAVDGSPLLGTYTASTLKDLALAKKVGMNVVIGGNEMLDPETPVGRFLYDNKIKVLHHLTRHIYGMPKLGDTIDPGQTEIPLSNPSSRSLPSPGVIQVEGELIRYEEFEGVLLKGCERGFNGTEPAPHYEGIFLFMPEECAREVEEVKDSPNLLGYYVLDDSPGDALSALKGMYGTIWRVDGGANHHVVCAGYGSPGSLCNFAPGVCDIMLIYWYPVSNEGYDRYMISHQVQWMLTTARSRVPGIPFIGVYQAFWGDGAVRPSPQQIREQAEDFVREGTSGLIAFACRIKPPWGGWADSEPIQEEMKKIHEEILTTGGLEVSPQPDGMARDRIQPIGFWEKPGEIEGIIPAWHVIGPFDDPEQGMLSRVCPPEKEINLGATYEGKSGPIHWIKRTTQSGSVGLGEIFGDQRATANSVAYGTCTVTSSRDQKVVLSLGSDDDIMVWLGGKEVWRHEGIRGVKRNDDLVPVTLPAGSTRILVKVCNRKGMWGFFARFVDLNGQPLKGLKFSPWV